MLICSGTMPTFEPLTTKQTNLALCSTIQTGFIDRRIAATRSSSGSSRAGINAAAGAAPGAAGHPPRAGPARGCCRPRALVPGTAQREERAMVPAKPFEPGEPQSALLCTAAEPRASVRVLLSFGCPQQLLQNDPRTL